MTQQYYSTTLGRALTTDQVRSNYGFYPDAYDISILNDQYGLFPINDWVVPTYNTNLYSGYTVAHVPNADGSTYDKMFALTELPLEDAKANAIAKLKDRADYDSIVALGGYPQSKNTYNAQSQFAPNGPYEQVGGESFSIFTAQSFLSASNRVEPYKSISAHINTIATTLTDTIALVEAATNVDEVRMAYCPVCGTLEVERTDDDITSAPISNLTGGVTDELSLLIVSTGQRVRYDESAGGFVTTGSALGGGDCDVALYASGTLMATFTIPNGNTTTTFTF